MPVPLALPERLGDGLEMFDTEYLLSTSPFSQSIYLDAVEEASLAHDADSDAAFGTPPRCDPSEACGGCVGCTAPGENPHHMPLARIRSIDDYPPNQASEHLHHHQPSVASPVSSFAAAGPHRTSIRSGHSHHQHHRHHNLNHYPLHQSQSPHRQSSGDFVLDEPSTLQPNARAIGLFDESRRKYPFQSFADHVYVLRVVVLLDELIYKFCRHHSSEQKPGGNILAFFERHSYSTHVIYALLSGRPLVIIGSPKYEDSIRALVKTLWLFVPGTSFREQVVPWWDRGSLTLADLGRVKLVGMSKKIPHAIPKFIERCVPICFAEAIV